MAKRGDRNVSKHSGQLEKLMRSEQRAWSRGTFENVASARGLFIRIDDSMKKSTSFERAWVLVETTWLESIDDIIGLVINDVSFHIRVTELEFVLGQMCRWTQTQVEEDNNQVVVWQHNDLWEESNEDDRGMFDKRVRRVVLCPMRMLLW
ncbi:hypothetical protein V6N11_004791 [Hibiscus sabdariffa]|uniref:DUF4283 domain-containing protein n=1 Tax=Hibiscus sabdariffa TaxID=183260 RepID=A0ABR2SH71_9ROSI